MSRLVRVALGLLLTLTLAACGPDRGGATPPAGSTPAPAASIGY